MPSVMATYRRAEVAERGEAACLFDALRVLPPLIVQDAHVQEAVAILDRTAFRLKAEIVGQAAE